MAYRWPHPTYFGPPAALAILYGARWMLEQYASQTDWWKDIPFVWLALIFVSFWAGLWAQDAFNRKSWVWHNLRVWRRVFDVVTLTSTHTWDDADRHATERVEIWCTLKFLEHLNDPLLTLRVTSPLEGRKPFRNLVWSERLGEVHQDALKRILIGSIAISRPILPEYKEAAERHGRRLSGRHSVWGAVLGGQDIAAGQVTMIPHSKNLIEMTVNSQTYRVFAHLTDATREDKTRIYLLTEDDEPPL